MWKEAEHRMLEKALRKYPHGVCVCVCVCAGVLGSYLSGGCLWVCVCARGVGMYPYAT